MRQGSGEDGAGAVEYLALIGVVIVMFLGLLALRPKRIDRHTPVDVIPPIVRLLGEPLRQPAPPRPPPMRPTTPRPSVPRRRPPRRAESDPVVPLPEWWR